MYLSVFFICLSFDLLYYIWSNYLIICSVAFISFISFSHSPPQPMWCCHFIFFYLFYSKNFLSFPLFFTMLTIRAFYIFWKVLYWQSYSYHNNLWFTHHCCACPPLLGRPSADPPLAASLGSLERQICGRGPPAHCCTCVRDREMQQGVVHAGMCVQSSLRWTVTLTRSSPLKYC